MSAGDNHPHDHHLLHPLRDRSLQAGPFEEYSRNWGQAIPRAGVDLIGYFAPHEGSTTTAYGVYNLDSLAAYEEYRARLATSPEGRANYEFAKRERFILKEDRMFLKLASAPHAKWVQP